MKKLKKRKSRRRVSLAFEIEFKRRRKGYLGCSVLLFGMIIAKVGPRVKESPELCEKLLKRKKASGRRVLVQFWKCMKRTKKEKRMKER